MTKHDDSQGIKPTGRKIIIFFLKVTGIIFGLITGIIILTVGLLYWSYQIPTNPADQYKTSIVYHGRTDMKVDCGNILKCPPEEMVFGFMVDTQISCGVNYNGKIFEIDIHETKYKEEALRLLRIGIAEGKIYIDEENYLVTE